MDRGTRRLFVVALVVLIAVVGLATIILGAPPAGGQPSGTTAVEGVIVGVDSQSLSDVRSFDLRTADGTVRTFGLAALENGTEFPPGHLVEHSATAQCGPTLDKVKPIAAAHPDVTFINVEPYQLEEVEGQLQPVLTDGKLTAAPATDEWRLPSEPWIFVVDRDGIVQGSFMLIVGDDELEAAVQAVS